MKRGVIGFTLVAFFAAVSAAGGFFSYRSVVSSSRTAEADAAARRSLQAELQRLDAGLTALDRR